MLLLLSVFKPLPLRLDQRSYSPITPQTAANRPWRCCRRSGTVHAVISDRIVIQRQGSFPDGERTLRDELPRLWSMARPNTLPLGTGLVAVGAFGARRTAGATGGVGGRLCLSALLTAITTSGSMLINDYHDHKHGVDNEKTKPGRPLVTGEVRAYSHTQCATLHCACVHVCMCTAGAARVGEVRAQVELRGTPHAALPRRRRLHSPLGPGQHDAHVRGLSPLGRWAATFRLKA